MSGALNLNRSVSFEYVNRGNRERGSKTIRSVCTNDDRTPSPPEVENEPKDSFH